MRGSFFLYWGKWTSQNFSVSSNDRTGASCVTSKGVGWGVIGPMGAWSGPGRIAVLEVCELGLGVEGGTEMGVGFLPI